MSQIELEREALRLDAKSRAELEILWAEEAHRRFAAFKRGEMKSYSREEALNRVKAAVS
jgi:Putative addiction module component